MENPFSDLVASLNSQNHKHLTFEEQCAFYAALQCGVTQAAVALAAKVSGPTISLLSNAGQVRAGQLRYPRVAREYQSLGHDAFVSKYATPWARERLDAASAQILHKKRNPDEAKGWSPRANAYEGVHHWPDASLGPCKFVIIPVPDRQGWFWRQLEPYAGPLRGNPLLDDGAREPGFANTKDCFRLCRSYFNPTQEERDSGYNDKLMDETALNARKILSKPS